MLRNTMIGMMAMMMAIGAHAATSYAQGEIDSLLPGDGSRFELDNVNGGVNVSTWDRRSVRIRASRAAGVEIYREGSVIQVSGGPDRRSRNAPIDFEITLPVHMDMEIETVNGDIVIRNAVASVEAQSVKGRVDVTGGRTVVDLSSVAGSVSLSGARGTVNVESVNASVMVRDVVGDLEAETVNGRIDLVDVDARRINASSINGRIEFDGVLHADGWYQFEAHNGTIVLRLPSNPQANVTVETHNGDIRSDFPTRITRGGHGEGASFTLGSGGARVTLETFNGSVELRRKQ